MRSSPLLLLASILLVIGAGAAVWFLTKTPQTTDSQGIANDTPTELTAAPRPIAGDAPAGKGDSRPIAAVENAIANTEGAASRVAAETTDNSAAPAEVEKFGTVVGQVIDFNGNAAPGAKVRIIGKKGVGFMMEPDAVTDDQGKFSAKLKLNKKKTMRLRVTREGRIAIVVPEIIIKRDEITDVGVLQFEPSGSLEVIVMDARNRPIPNASVHLKHTKNESSENANNLGAEVKRRDEDPTVYAERAMSLVSGERTTGEDGVARYAALPPGRVKVTVDSPSGGAFGGLTARISNAENSGGGFGVKTNVKVTNKKDGAADNAANNTNNNSSSVREPKFEAPPPKEIDITAGRAEKLEVVLNGLGVLTGRATLNGKPLANEWLGLGAASSTSSYIGRFTGGVRTQTNGDGKFTFPPVPPGEFVVTKGDPGPSFQMEKFTDPDQMAEEGMKFAQSMFGGKKDKLQDLSRAVSVGEGDNTTNIDFGGSVIEVFVQDADSGKPIENATVRLFDHEEEESKSNMAAAAQNDLVPLNAKMLRSLLPRSDGKRSVRLKASGDARGRAEFNNIEGGKFRIIARVDGRPPSYATDFELTSGEHKQVVVKVPRSLTIAGTVNDKIGNALAEASIRALPNRELEPSFPDEIFMWMGAGGPTATSDNKGIFKINGLDSGAYKIVAMARGYAPSLIQASAPSEGNQFFLEKCGTIRIYVARGGKPVGGAMVSLDKDAKDAPVPSEVWEAMNIFDMANIQDHADSTDENGYAILKNIPPGEWSVSVRNFRGRDNATKGDEDLTKDLTSGDSSEDINKRMKEMRAKMDKLTGKQTIRVHVSSETESSARVDLP